MTQSIYKPCLFYRSGVIGIVRMQTNDILILANNDFDSNKEEAVKAVKLMIKDYKYPTFIQFIKFNKTQIKLNSNGIILIKKSHISSILLVIDHDIDSTNLQEITRKKLLLKKP